MHAFVAAVACKGLAQSLALADRDEPARRVARILREGPGAEPAAARVRRRLTQA